MTCDARFDFTLVWVTILSDVCARHKPQRQPDFERIPP